MTGFFRGPSLFVHVFIVAVFAAVSVTTLNMHTGSLALAIGVTAAVIFMYAVIALYLSVRK